LFGFVEFVFVADAFEFAALIDQSSIGLLHIALLVHDLSYFFGHHLGHLFAHIVLQLIKVV
jgi:hypothetical protein